MSRQDSADEPIRQPARGQPIKQPRPQLDWGDEEPDPVWERLYYMGLVNPPYPDGRGFGEVSEKMRETINSWEPIGKPMTDDELMCALGRCRCDRCQ